MKTSLFDFILPDNLIARQPAARRDEARLLVVNDGIGDASIPDLLSYMKPGDVLVMNDTRVIPARLFGMRGETKIELLLHKELGAGQWQCFAKPAKKLREGDTLRFAHDFFGAVQEKREDGQVVVEFADANSLHKNLERYGHMPLPPYIDRADNKTDKERYQTVYAANDGSVAAPTAGLHFTPELLAAIEKAGIKRVHVTLHVGGGTFLPVKAEDTAEHKMHSEWACISQEAADAINEAKANGGRIIAVGTTSLRTLESAADEKGRVHAMQRETDIFITPGYRFKAVDILLTNFHLPRSTLFMLVCAFAGMEKMKDAYAHAIKSGYRFYSYGDACLLFRN